MKHYSNVIFFIAELYVAFCTAIFRMSSKAKINKPIHTFSLLIVLAAFLFSHINLKARAAIALELWLY